MLPRCVVLAFPVSLMLHRSERALRLASRHLPDSVTGCRASDIPDKIIFSSSSRRLPGGCPSSWRPDQRNIALSLRCDSGLPMARIPAADSIADAIKCWALSPPLQWSLARWLHPERNNTAKGINTRTSSTSLRENPVQDGASTYGYG